MSMYRSRIRCRLLAPAALAGLLLISSVATAPGASAATEANTSYVVSLYADLLDRDVLGSDPGVAYWAGLLDFGVSRTSVARAIQNASTEYYGNIVEFTYQRYLDRTADIGGYGYFVDGWRSKAFTLELVTAVIVGSSEYYALHDSSDADFVDAAYFDILGRQADSAGRAYFLTIAAAYGRTMVAGVLVQSPENRRAEIRFAIDSYLGRPAEGSEVEFFLAALQNGMRREEVDVQIVGSAEYYDNT
jgi:hypothetical protein